MYSVYVLRSCLCPAAVLEVFVLVAVAHLVLLLALIHRLPRVDNLVAALKKEEYRIQGRGTADETF